MSVWWWKMLWFLGHVGATALFCAEVLTLWPTTAFSSSVQMSMQWKRHRYSNYNENSFEFIDLWKTLRDPRGVQEFHFENSGLLDDVPVKDSVEQYGFTMCSPCLFHPLASLSWALWLLDPSLDYRPEWRMSTFWSLSRELKGLKGLRGKQRPLAGSRTLRSSK